MLEIQKTFDFFKATASSDRIDRIMLSGGASRAEGLHRDAERPVRGAGRGARSVQARRRSTRRSSRWNRRPTSRRRRRSRSASRSAGWATDDPHQSPRGRSGAHQARGALIPAAHRVTIAASLILIGTALFVGWWFWSLRPGVGPARRGHRQGRARDAAAAIGPRAGAEVRGAQGAASAARHAHRAAAPRPERPRAHARRNQQGRPRAAVAHRLDAEGRRLHARRHDDVVDRACRISSRTSKAAPGSRSRSTSSTARCTTDSEDRRHVQVFGEGRVQQPGSAAAAAAAGDGRAAVARRRAK